MAKFAVLLLLCLVVSMADCHDLRIPDNFRWQLPRDQLIIPQWFLTLVEGLFQNTLQGILPSAATAVNNMAKYPVTSPVIYATRPMRFGFGNRTTPTPATETTATRSTPSEQTSPNMVTTRPTTETSTSEKPEVEMRTIKGVSAALLVLDFLRDYPFLWKCALDCRNSSEGKESLLILCLQNCDEDRSGEEPETSVSTTTNISTTQAKTEKTPPKTATTATTYRESAVAVFVADGSGEEPETSVSTTANISTTEAEKEKTPPKTTTTATTYREIITTIPYQISPENSTDSPANYTTTPSIPSTAKVQEEDTKHCKEICTEIGQCVGKRTRKTKKEWLQKLPEPCVKCLKKSCGKGEGKERYKSACDYAAIIGNCKDDCEDVPACPFCFEC